LHRGRTSPNLPAEQIIADRRDLASLRIKADVVIDMILSSGTQAQQLMDAFRGNAGRVVAASSGDVYRACGVLHGSEEGPLQPMPLREDSALRTVQQTYPPEVMALLKKFFAWVDDDYDKIPVERTVMSDPELLGTVVRLPMTYGPGDYGHRFWPVLKRILDGRPFILLEDAFARWRGPRGYVENVAAAMVTAAISETAAGRIYNFAERPSYSELEWAEKIASAMSWSGRFVTLPRDRTPAHLIQAGNLQQHWEMDSTRIRDELGYVDPVGLDEAIRRAIEWERANPPGELNPGRFDYPAEDAAVAL
jgi:nucleoside-diphosphate-sugar epimerase